ncbi:TIGR00730 family Rossman fold protein [Sagittula sp. S175]|uniref:LOG family protein n=1 Tax=Sagittula sp. S175 TaxID=3415129 RepID=UPI003C7AB80E
MKQIAVFCGSSAGNAREYTDAAIALGTALARQSITLVYGGGKVGLMGQIADACLAAGGRATGIMPEALVAREIFHPDLSELKIVPDMATRKARMSDLSDGFIAMPEDAGTLEEITEQWVWGQLGLHAKPVAFFNVNGFYDPLMGFIDQMVEHAFLQHQFREMLICSDTVETLLEGMRAYQPPKMKWT